MPARPEMRTPKRGRPRMLDTAGILAEADFFTPDALGIAVLARRLGVGETTLRDHVGTGNDLYLLSCDQRLQRLDPEAPGVHDWTAYISVVCERISTLVLTHPGIERYIIYGPYHPGALSLFESIVAQTIAREPSLDRRTAYLACSQATILTASIAGLLPASKPSSAVQDTMPRSTRWALEALLDGMSRKIEAGDVPESSPVIGDQREHHIR